MRSGASAVHGDIQQGDEKFRGTARLNNRQLASALPAGRVHSRINFFSSKVAIDVLISELSPSGLNPEFLVACAEFRPKST
jgi:hypothetical protein